MAPGVSVAASAMLQGGRAIGWFVDERGGVWGEVVAEEVGSVEGDVRFRWGVCLTGSGE